MTPEQQRVLAIARARQRQAAQAKEPETNMVEQTGIGVNEGLANFAGMPVDMMTNIINGAFAKPQYAPEMIAGPDGRPMPSPDAQITPGNQITDPIGGSAYINEARKEVLRDVPPDTTAQKWGRKVGQEVGASVIPGAGVAGLPGRMGQAARASMGQYAATETAGAVGSGLGAAAANEIAPDSAMAEIIGQLLGGATGATGVQMAKPRPQQAPSMDDLYARQSDAYGRVDASDSRLTPDSTTALQEAIKTRAARDTMDPVLAPKAHRTGEKIGEMQTPTINEVEKMRRLTGKVAGNLDPTEAGLGAGMKQEITDYLDNLKPDDVTGSDPEAAVSALREGRDMTRRIKKSEQIAEALTKGERRAATSGTGGNEVNAIRQNIRAILDSPKKRAGYTAEEIEAMEEIARGSTTQNILRGIGRFSPTAGALPAMGGLTATGALGPMGAVPSAVGMLAKGTAEFSTQKSLKGLQEMIRNGAPIDPKRLSDAQKSAIASLLVSKLSGDYANR